MRFRKTGENMRTFRLENFCTTPGLFLHLLRQLPPAGHYEAPHVHNYMEILYIQSGSGVNTIADSDYPIIPGDIYVIPPGTLHTFCITHRAVTFNLLVDFRAFSDLEMRSLKEFPDFEKIFTERKNTGSCLRLTAADSMKTASMMTSAERVLRGRSPGYAAELHAGTLLILLEICRKAECLRNPGRGTRECAGKLSLLSSYISEHFRSRISLEQIAEIAGMTPNSASRFFVRGMGVPMMTYVNRLRISEACRLLAAEPDMNVTEIAEACGFHDTSYFIRIFRKLMKRSPLVFRKEQRSNGDPSLP